MAQIVMLVDRSGIQQKTYRIGILLVRDHGSTSNRRNLVKIAKSPLSWRRVDM